MTAWKTGNFAEQLKSKKETPAEKAKEAPQPVAPAPTSVVVVAQEAPKPQAPITPTRGAQGKANSPSKAQKATPPAPLPPAVAVDVAPEPVASVETAPPPEQKSIASPTTVAQPCIADPVLPATSPTQDPEPLVTLPAEFACLVTPGRFTFSGTVKEAVAQQPPVPQVHVQPRRAPPSAGQSGGSATPPPREAAPMPYANGPPPPVYDPASFNAPTNFFPQQQGYGYGGGYPQQYIPSGRGGRGNAQFQAGLFTGNNYGRGYRGNQPPQPYYNAQQPMGYSRPPFYQQQPPYYPSNNRGPRGPNPAAESATENGATE